MSPTPRPWTSPAWCWSARSTGTSSRRSTSTPRWRSACPERTPGIISAEARDPQLGFVGEVTAVNPDLLNRLLAEDLIPVVATIGSDPTGQAYNINADTAAGAMAEAVGATKLVYLTDVDGIRRDRDDPASRLSVGHDRRAGRHAGRRHGRRRHDPQGSLVHARRQRRGGPRPTSSTAAARHALLLEIFTREGVGTMVTRSQDTL